MAQQTFAEMQEEYTDYLNRLKTRGGSASTCIKLGWSISRRIDYFKRIMTKTGTNKDTCPITILQVDPEAQSHMNIRASWDKCIEGKTFLCIPGHFQFTDHEKHYIYQLFGSIHHTTLDRIKDIVSEPIIIPPILDEILS